MSNLHPHQNPIKDQPLSFALSDIRDLHELDLDDINVMNGVCRAMNLRVMTEWYTRDKDRWFVARNDAIADIFSGSWVELRAWVRGYASAWVDGISKSRRVRSVIIEALAENG